MSFKSLETNWSLDELYESFECEKFKSDFEKMKNDIPQITEKAREFTKNHNNEVEKIIWFVGVENNISNYHLIASYAGLRLAINAEDETAMKIQNLTEVLLSDLTEASVLFQKFIADVNDIDALLSENENLHEFEFHLKEIKEQSKYLLSEAEEIAIAKFTITGSSAWGELQSHLTSTLMIDIELDDQLTQKPLTVIRNMAYESDAALREKAYYAELKGYEKIDKSVSFALNSIKGEALSESALRGYESPLSMTLINARMDAQTLNALISSMEDFLPSLRKFYKKKADLLDKSNGLPFYDLFAPVGKADMRFTYEEAADYVVSNFNAFSEKLGSYAENAFKNRWIDALPKEGKSGGAFCANLHSIKQSRIMANFDGSFNDVTTLAHELGHGYHGFMLEDDAFVNSDYPMPIAETASTFCETIVTNAALSGKNLTSDEKMVILDNMISDELQVIVDIYSRFTFESDVFTQRENGSLSVNEFKEMMLSAQKKAYGDGLDNDFLHPYMWLCKGHYYSAGYNFYNFPYAYGLLFAKGLYAQYLNENDTFLPKYDALLAATGKKNLADIAAMAGIDVRSKAFWSSSLELVEKDVEMFCNM